MISRSLSLFFITIFLFSLPIMCRNKGSNSLGKVQVEFQPESVPGSILSKFSELFEDVKSQPFDDLPDFYDEENEEYYDEEYDDESYEEEMALDDYVEVDDELSFIAEKNSTTNEELLENKYKDFVYKLCVLTAISKETTIYASESVNV